MRKPNFSSHLLELLTAIGFFIKENRIRIQNSRRKANSPERREKEAFGAGHTFHYQ
jgi:hypothetical protein